MNILIPALHRPSKPTGVCRHAANLAQCLIESDSVQKVTLVVGEWQRNYFSKLLINSANKIELIYVSLKNNSLSRNLWYLFGLPKLSSKRKLDIIHLPFPIPVISSSFQCPVVSSIHDLYPYEIPENFGFPQVLFNRLFLRVCLLNSSGLASVSQTTSQALNKFFPEVQSDKPCPVVYNYVDFNEISATVSDEIKFCQNKPFILTVAQHRKNKNLDILIDAFFELRNEPEFEKMQLIIVGSSGPETESLIQKISKLALEESVHLLSAIDDSDLTWLYKNCQLFTIPSSFEGFCLPLVEALNLGCRVVCSDIPILREVGSKACSYFVLSESPVENLKNTIQNTLHNESQKSYQLDPRFLKQTAKKQYLNLYRSVTVNAE